MLSKKFFAALVAVICLALPVRAQYYELANQLPSLLSPALSGSMNYRGFVQVHGLAGLGQARANFVGISTSQGFQYTNWFFMGVGVGIDAAIGNRDHGTYSDSQWGYAPEGSDTRVLLPVFSDFRFDIGTGSPTTFFIDAKLGAAWLLGDGYLRLNSSGSKLLSNATQFYFQPTVGLRFPVSSTNAKQAMTIGATYQLLTAGNNCYGGYSTTVSALGITVGFEW